MRSTRSYRLHRRFAPGTRHPQVCGVAGVELRSGTGRRERIGGLRGRRDAPPQLFAHEALEHRRERGQVQRARRRAPGERPFRNRAPGAGSGRPRRAGPWPNARRRAAAKPRAPAGTGPRAVKPGAPRTRRRADTPGCRRGPIQPPRWARAAARARPPRAGPRSSIRPAAPADRGRAVSARRLRARRRRDGSDAARRIPLALFTAVSASWRISVLPAVESGAVEQASDVEPARASIETMDRDSSLEELSLGPGCLELAGRIRCAHTTPGGRSDADHPCKR